MNNRKIEVEKSVESEKPTIQSQKEPVLIKNLPYEFRNKLILAGFDENETIDSHATINAYMLGNYRMTPLTWAAKCGDLELTECLLSNRAAVDLRDKTYKLTPVMWATWFARHKIVKKLTSYGADVCLEGKIPGYSEGNAYQYTKKFHTCGPTNFWYNAQYYLGDGDIAKTREALKFHTPKNTRK